MRLRVLGAAGEVTGSNYLVEVGNSRVLIDVGIHQGKDEEKRNREPFPFEPSSIDAVLLTHAHLDHTGRVPLLLRQGFGGKIWATMPTTELVDVLWNDSVKIMKEEAQWQSRKNRRRGLPPVEPLFEEGDVERALEVLRPISYDDVLDVAPGVKVRFRDAGHILGSAIVELWAKDDGRQVKIVFSGDLGPQKTVMERNPAFIEEADYVVIESTYGDREHRSNEETRLEFRQIMEQALRDRSKVMIPTFVVDRAQRVLYELMLLQQEGLLKDNVPLYFDSPMGVKATEIYRRHLSLLSSEIQEQIKKGNDPFAPKQLRFVAGVDESKAINDVRHAVVLAGSGMANAGRIVHHLKNNIWDEKSHVVFVGYQARGTLGRRLVEGQELVRIAGEEVSVRAQLHTVNGFSAHADRTDLLAWASAFANGPMFLVTHGEPKSATALAAALEERGYRAVVPQVGDEFDLVPAEKGFEPALVVPAFGLAERDEAEELLADVASLAVRLGEAMKGDVTSVLPLLQSARTLLETAGDRLGLAEATKEKVGASKE
jgi:metallo-beta-lactamase family protein